MIIGPKKEDFDTRFEEDEQDEDFDANKRKEKKYETCREHEALAEKEKKNRSGNKATNDNDWS